MNPDEQKRLGKLVEQNSELLEMVRKAVEKEDDITYFCHHCKDGPRCEFELCQFTPKSKE